MWIAILIPIAVVIITFILGKKEKLPPSLELIVGLTGGGVLMIFGYYIFGGLIYGNFIMAALGIPANILQFLAGFFIAMIISKALRKTYVKKYFVYKFDR